MQCPVCLESESFDDAKWVKMSCGHCMHTMCALKNAWAGNIGCPICRAIPLNLDRDDIQENIDEATRAHNKKEMQRLFLKGLREYKKAQGAGNKKSNSKLRNAVVAYEKHKEKIKAEQELRVKERQATSQMKVLIQNPFNKLKTQLTKTHGEKAVSKIKLQVTSSRNYRFRSDRQYKRRIAQAMGWQCLRYP